MVEYRHSASDGPDDIFRNLGLDQFLAIDRGSCNNRTVWVDYGRGATESNTVIRSRHVCVEIAGCAGNLGSSHFHDLGS